MKRSPQCPVGTLHVPVRSPSICDVPVRSAFMCLCEPMDMHNAHMSPRAASQLLLLWSVGRHWTVEGSAVRVRMQRMWTSCNCLRVVAPKTFATDAGLCGTAAHRVGCQRHANEAICAMLPFRLLSVDSQTQPAGKRIDHPPVSTGNPTISDMSIRMRPLARWKGAKWAAVFRGAGQPLSFASLASGGPWTVDRGPVASVTGLQCASHMLASVNGHGHGRRA